MCFSATASFTAAAVLATIGVATLRHVREPRAAVRVLPVFGRAGVAVARGAARACCGRSQRVPVLALRDRDPPAADRRLSPPIPSRFPGEGRGPAVARFEVRALSALANTFASGPRPAPEKESGSFGRSVAVFVCQDKRQPRGQQPILRFASAEAAIEARPPSGYRRKLGATGSVSFARVRQPGFSGTSSVACGCHRPRPTSGQHRSGPQ